MLKIEHLTKIFGKGTINEMTALNDVNFHGSAGDFITIIGSNGAGKSTLMNCIAGVFPAESGTITLDGIDITKMPGLEDRMKEKVRLLSGGQRQALTLFMAVIAKPKLLLLDEHTAALDPSAARKVLEQTDYFAKDEKLCTMMITHNMKAALEHGNRTILMQGGQIKMDIRGREREEMTVEKLIEKFEIDNDRMLL